MAYIHPDLMGLPAYRMPEFHFQPPPQSPVAEQPIAYYQPSLTLAELILRGLLIAGVLYVGYKVFFEPDERVLHCSECGRITHTARNCPFTGDRHHFHLAVEKTGWCQCCGYSFAYTELHHYGGRADDSKGKEMCGPCHLHCGHSGDFHNFAVNPRYCRIAA